MCVHVYLPVKFVIKFTMTFMPKLLLTQVIQMDVVKCIICWRSVPVIRSVSNNQIYRTKRQHLPELSVKSTAWQALLTSE